MRYFKVDLLAGRIYLLGQKHIFVMIVFCRLSVRSHLLLVAGMRQ